MDYQTATFEHEMLKAVCLLSIDDSVPQERAKKQSASRVKNDRSVTEENIINNTKNVINTSNGHTDENDLYENTNVRTPDENGCGQDIRVRTLGEPDDFVLEKSIFAKKTGEKDAINNTSDTQCFRLPDNLEIGQAVADGSCFFDSFRRGLQRLGVVVTIGDLRTNCREFAESDPPDWFIDAIGDSHRRGSARREAVAEYTEHIHRNDRWGDPDVEGRILCGRYGVSLYVIERQRAADENIYTYQRIDSNGCRCVANIDFDRQNTLYIINQGRGHFEPLINKPHLDRTIHLDIQPNKVQDSNKTNSHSTSKVCQQHLVQKPISLNVCSIKKRLTIAAFNKFEDAIGRGDIQRLNNLIKFLYQTVDKTCLSSIYDDCHNSLRNTHLITLACKYHQPLVLDFLLHKSNILCYLPNEGTAVARAYYQALCETMRSADIHMLETLYDHLSGDVHWLGHAARSDAGAVIDNLKWLNTLLVKARDSCLNSLIGYQQMLVDVHCLICFNGFQIEAYTELSNMKTNRVNGDTDARRTELEDTIAVLLIAFRVYEKYSDKNIRLAKVLQKDEIRLQPLFKQDSIYMKYLNYFMYELYYRKLDYNIALLIINNLHLLKLRLMMPNDAYQEIESTLYYFLYRVNEDWKLYLPENRPKFESPTFGIENGFLKLVKCLYDPHRLFNGPVIYLEWLKYKKSLSKFKEHLEKINIETSLRKKGTKLPKDEINQLLLLPYMRDDYSLKKILHYLEQISWVDFKQDKEVSLLIIQRVIQVTGEFLKSTDDSYHLSPTTLALLQVEIPRGTYKQLTNLRDDLSHARDGKLIRKIDLEENESCVFEDAFKDIKKIKKAIREVIKIYKPVLEKSLLRQGWRLIVDRYAELPEEATNYRRTIEGIMHTFEIGYNVYMQMENNFIDERWKPLGFTRQLFREIGGLEINLNNLITQWNMRKDDSRKLITKKLCKYTKDILQTIVEVEGEIDIWKSIKQDLVRIRSFDADDCPPTFKVLDHPNGTCIRNIKNHLKNIRHSNELKSDIMHKLNTVKDWSAEWLQIRKLIAFIVVEVDYFERHHWEIKRSAITCLCTNIDEGCPDGKGTCNVRWFIGMLNEHSQTYREDIATSDAQTDEEPYEYGSLRVLAEAMHKTFFITKIEMDYLKSKRYDACECKAKCNHREVFHKLYNNRVINEKEHESLKSLKIDHKCRKIIENLVNGMKRDNKMLECLVNRTKLLCGLLEGNKEAEKLVLRYRHDERFRIAFELILSDIMNIYSEGWLVELANKSCTKLLAEYPLRHILEHGNPLLDVSDAAFNANDFPKELVTFALDVVDNGVYLDSLLELHEAGVDRADVTNSSDNLDDKQKGLVNKFKECSKWRIFVKLLPDKSQIRPKKKQNKQFRKTK